MHRVACFLLVTGCVHDYTATVREVADQRAGNVTTVTTAYGDRRVTDDDVVEVRSPIGARTTVRIADLLAEQPLPADSVVVLGRGRRLTTGHVKP